MRTQTYFWIFAVPAVLAQTFTDCNPLEKTCPDDPALGTTYSWDFTKGASDKFTPTGSKDKIKYTSEGMILPVAASGDSPTITSDFYIFWGKVDIVMQAAPGQGIVSSLVFESDDLDEIDYEWIGSETTQVQTNYFGKGDTSVYDRGGKTAVSNPSGSFHTYSIEWTSSSVKWSIDGNLIRTLTPDQVTPTIKHKELYPQTPMKIKIGSWSGGDPGNSKGTIDWAGGETDYTKGPYTMKVKSVTVQDYSVGATSYKYGDKSGSWQSIVISKDGSSSSGSSDKPVSSSETAPKSTSAPSTPDAPSKPSSTAAAEKPEKPTSTLATSVRPTASEKPTKTSTQPAKTNMPGLIMSGLPNSLGNYNGQDKGVNASTSAVTTTTTPATRTSATAAAKTSGTSLPVSTTAAATPSAATNSASTLQAGAGSIFLAIVGAIVLL